MSPISNSLSNRQKTTLLGATHLAPSDFVSGDIVPIIFDFDGGQPGYAGARDLYYPLWQQSPPPFEATLINFDYSWLSFGASALKSVEVLRGKWSQMLGQE